VILAFILSLSYRLLVNQRKLKDLKEEKKLLDDKIKKSKEAGRKEEEDRLRQEQMKMVTKMSGSNMKAMIASLIIFFFAIPFVTGLFVFNANLTDNVGSFTVNDITLYVEKNDDVIVVGGASDFEFSPTESKRFNINGNVWHARYQGASVFGAEAVVFEKTAVVSPVPIPILGRDLGWFWWYLIIIFGFNMFFRKMLGMEMS